MSTILDRLDEYEKRARLGHEVAATSRVVAVRGYAAIPLDNLRALIDAARAFADLNEDVRKRYGLAPHDKFKCPIMQRGHDALAPLMEEAE